MAIKLTQKEADSLIAMLKKTIEKEIAFPHNKGRVEFDVVGDRREDVFVINISRKGINDSGASYQGRIKTRGIILLRLDVNPTSVHMNPDGEKIAETHLHIYSEQHEMAFAIPFDIKNKDLYQLCYRFFEKFNIIDPPSITQQLRITEVGWNGYTKND